MMTFYAAIGSYRIRKENGRLVPYIQKLGRLHPISIPEFVIWSTLLWEVMTYQELKNQFDKQMSQFQGPAPDFDTLLEMLKKRKLITCGLGYSGSDALYNMLSDAFVVPYHIVGGRKIWTVIKLWVKGSISFPDICRLMKAPKTSEDEARVIQLIEQTPLSTSEIICCFAKDIQDVSTAEKVIAGIYAAESDDQVSIANAQKNAEQRDAVLTAVSNLYLQRRILLELA